MIATAKSALSSDIVLFQSCLRKLYEVIYTDIQEFGDRHKFASGYAIIFTPLYMTKLNIILHVFPFKIEQHSAFVASYV